jgi:radical SAM-linked protein
VDNSFFRIQYRKSEPYISQIDLLNLFRRAFRRAGLSIAYSEGFNPQPVMSFGPALPLGFTGGQELLDVKMSIDYEPGVIMESLKQAMPGALEINSVTALKPGEPAINKIVDKAVYTYNIDGQNIAHIKHALDRMLKQETIEVVQKTPKKIRKRDFKPFIHAIEIISTENSDFLIFTLNMINGNLPSPCHLFPLIFGEDYPGKDGAIQHLNRKEIILKNCRGTEK